MPKLRIGAMLVASTMIYVACGADHEDQQRVWEDETGRVTLVELAPEDEATLKTAPMTNLKGVVPGQLEEAIDLKLIESIKVQLVQDKINGDVIDESPPTYQGWIYYEPTKLSDGSPFAPAVLCVSQSDPIEWKHCQDASQLATMRLVKERRH